MTPNADAPPSSQTDPQIPPNWRYEDTIQTVESIINEIEMGQLDLAEVFEKFAVAITYLQQCETFLADRQGQMELLIEELGEDSDF
ncbi:exodeoxyribonuclease VII small subunit [Acaryochloris sp. IP29b_bin.148]|uniref:exodeoxyribonuclease VII small subunit n=1 Tax=Acaryochloris sp. IP29b_bin.148 TaxID=2969218 RepID=UPI002604A92E|nr:exodeoxyribonuclease VII small subunit [Acaryochloris sp. IP29b_bin.148]